MLKLSGVLICIHLPEFFDESLVFTQRQSSTQSATTNGISGAAEIRKMCTFASAYRIKAGMHKSLLQRINSAVVDGINGTLTALDVARVRSQTNHNLPGLPLATRWPINHSEAEPIGDAHRRRRHIVPLPIAAGDPDSVMHARSIDPVRRRRFQPAAFSYGLTPTHTSKEDAQKEFFEIAGILPGSSCKRSGFFKGRGCALGCKCQWFQYCDKTPEDASEYVKVGICHRRWAVFLVPFLLISCLFFMALAMKPKKKEEVTGSETPTFGASDTHMSVVDMFSSWTSAPWTPASRGTDAQPAFYVDFEDQMTNIGPTSRFQWLWRPFAHRDRTPFPVDSERH